jgi:hypothetical protein
MAVPWPHLLGAHPFSATTALLPAVLSAALVVPSLTTAPASLAGADVGAVLVAQAAPRVRPSPPAIEPMTPVAIAPAAVAAPESAREKAARDVHVLRTVAPSQQQRGALPAPTEDQAAAVRRYEFDNDEVEGDLARPDGVHVPGDPVVKHASLIEIRREFVTEIAKMLEDL